MSCLIAPKRIAISLGYNCDPAVQGVEHGLRKRKRHGYKTCPFDECVSNYAGLVECIRDDFKYFADPDYLRIVTVPFPPPPGQEYEKWIYNTRYHFYFNHESPYHADLYLKERWPTGPNHFVDNNFKHFIERYERRIANFRYYISMRNTKISFMIAKGSVDTFELDVELKKRYPCLKYSFLKLMVNDPEGYKHSMALPNLSSIDVAGR